jgi:GDP-L-fucose synthase
VIKENNKMKILVTGSNGLVGWALRQTAKNSAHDWVFTTRDDADLTLVDEAHELFVKHLPDACINLAADVGGIGKNLAEPHSMFVNNIRINTNVIEACLSHRVSRLLSFSSVCVFPDDLALLEEDKMHTGPVFDANFAYGYAKRMVDVQIRAAKKEHPSIATHWCSVIPGNIAGEGDNFSLKNGHIIPALIHRIYKAKQCNEDFVVWGDGKSLREFIYTRDLAYILLRLLDLDEVPERLIVSGPVEYSIRQVVDILVSSADFKGRVVWDTTKPNGQRSRPSSKKLLSEVFPDMLFTNIEYWLPETYKWFERNYPDVRM